MMEKYGSNTRYELKRDNYIERNKDSSENSGLVSVLDEPQPGEIIDEPVPAIIDSCCCPCPPKTSVAPFLAFCPLE